MRTTPMQINRLRTLLAWCEDHTHALPDGWSLTFYSTDTIELSWLDQDRGDEIAAQVREKFGPPSAVLNAGDSLSHWWDGHAGRPRLVVHYITREDLDAALVAATEQVTA